MLGLLVIVLWVYDALRRSVARAMAPREMTRMGGVMWIVLAIILNCGGFGENLN